MTKRFVIFILIFSISTIGFGAGVVRQTLLRDGFILRSVDGKVSGPDGNDVWFFEFESDVSGDGAVVKKGTSLQMLPSATLERIAADITERSDTTYQLWGSVTKYKGRNFIFPVFFLPLSKIKEPQPQTSPPQAPQQQKSEPNETLSKVNDESEPVINEPNDILAVPEEILKILESRRTETSKRPVGEMSRRPVVQPPRQETGQAFQQDTVIVNRTGFILSREMRDLYRPERNTQYGFVFDALGRNIPKESFRLLPCEALEHAEQRQSAELETLKFQIAGIVTKYKDQNYLLLQKATPVYSYGNFGR